MSPRLTWLALLLLLASACPAAAQPPARPPPQSPTAVNNYCWNGAAVAMCGSAGTTGVPPPVTGFGTLSATGTFALASTLTLGPSSAGWPAAPGMVYVVNAPASAGTVFVCPLGGTCTTANGIPIAAGSAYGLFRPSTAMTLVAASTATVSFQF